MTSSETAAVQQRTCSTANNNNNNTSITNLKQKQCNVINLNLTNTNTLLSRRLTLTAATATTANLDEHEEQDEQAEEDEEDDEEEEEDVEQQQQQHEEEDAIEQTNIKHDESKRDNNNNNNINNKEEKLRRLVSKNAALTGDTSPPKKHQLINNFQNTLRTYCLSDCDYLNRQKKLRLKNFNAKIRRSIRNQMKKRQHDSKYLQQLSNSKYELNYNDVNNNINNINNNGGNHSDCSKQDDCEQSPANSADVGAIKAYTKLQTLNHLNESTSQPIMRMDESTRLRNSRENSLLLNEILSKRAGGRLPADLKQDFASGSFNSATAKSGRRVPTLFGNMETKTRHELVTDVVDRQSNYCAAAAASTTTTIANNLSSSLLNVEQSKQKLQQQQQQQEELVDELSTGNVHSQVSCVADVVVVEQKGGVVEEESDDSIEELRTSLQTTTNEKNINTIKELKIDLEKKVEEKKTLIKNLNLTGNNNNNNTISSSNNNNNSSSTTTITIRNNYIDESGLNSTLSFIASKEFEAIENKFTSIKSVSALAKVNLDKVEEINKETAAAATRTTTTSIKSNEFVRLKDACKLQPPRRKLIFKRNFSDESDEELKVQHIVNAPPPNPSTEPQAPNETKLSVAVNATEWDNENNKQREYNSDSIHRVYEKTKILIRNFYKNFDLLNENQQRLEQQIQIEQATKECSRMHAVSLQQNCANATLNASLTNTPYTPHWFNVATMGTNYNTHSSSAKSAAKNTRLINKEKVESNASLSPSVYLYSSISTINKGNQPPALPSDGKVILNNFRGYKLTTLKKEVSADNEQLDDTLSVRNKSLSPLRAVSDRENCVNKSQSINSKTLLNREKQRLVAFTEKNEQFDNENNLNHFESSEANCNESTPAANPNQEDTTTTAAAATTTEYVKFPNLSKTKSVKHKRDTSPGSLELSDGDNLLSSSNNLKPSNSKVAAQNQSSTSQQHQSRLQQQNTNNAGAKPASTLLAGQNYVLAQMSKYQRNNSINLLNLSTNKFLANQTNCHNNNFMSSGVIKTSKNQQLLKQKEQVLADVDLSAKSGFAANQILCRGNTLIARELSQHVLNQQQKIKTLDTMQQQQQQQQQQQAPLGSFNSSKVKLSQIQVKPKSSSSLLNQKSDSNTNISNGNGGGGGTENASNSSSAPSSAKTTTTSALNETSNTQDETKPPAEDEASKTSREEAKKAEQALISLKNKRYEETPLSKPQGLYTYAVTSSCQLRESFYNNRSLINTSSNCTNQIIYNRSDSFLNSSSSNEELNLTDNTNYALPSPIEEIKNTKKNRRLFKDLDFIYNEQQVFKLSRQIWFQIRTNKYRTAQNRLNENHLNQYLDQLNNSSMLINKLYNYDVYKFYERAKISLLIKCLQPLKSNFNRSGYNSNSGAGSADAQTNHIMRNINNISNLSSANMGGASSSSIAAAATAGHYMIDKDLVFVKKDSGKNLTIEEENSDEEAKRNEVIDRELFYAELEEASKLGEENDEDDLDEDDDSDSLKNEDGLDSLETNGNMNRKNVKTNLNASNGLLSLKHAS